MARNVGSTDRTVRLVVGAATALAGFAVLGDRFALAAGSLDTALGSILVVVGLALVYTGYTQVCFVYRVLGIDTYHEESGERNDDDDSQSGPSA